MKSLFRFALLALVLLVVALVSALTAMRLAIHTREVAVPDLVGKTPTEGRRIAEASGLQMDVERQYYSPTVPEGRIMSQLPVAETRVRRGWDVRVAESLGPQRVEIPDLLGQSERAAEINVRRRGLDIEAVARMNLPGTPADQVLSQNPTPKASGVSAPKISLLVTEPPSAPEFVMPSFIGQPVSNVVPVVLAAGLRVGSITNIPITANSSGTPAANAQPGSTGMIVEQEPAPGQKVTAGQVVNFQVR